MVLLVEQERLLADELQLINDPTAYGLPSTFGTVHDYGNITISKAGFLALNFQAYNPTSSSHIVELRLKIGGTIIWGNGFTNLGAGSAQTYGVLVYLAAGTYDILFEGYFDYTAAGVVYLQNVQVGFCNFNDASGSAVATYTSQLSASTPTRTIPVGTLARTTLLIQVAAYTSGAVTNMENVGDNFTNGVSITVDGVQQHWTEKYDDSNSSYLNAASGKLCIPATITDVHTIAISKRNANTTVNISVICCPWILTSIISVLYLNLIFSQGSTFYCWLEPLFLNSTKFIGVGKTRAISFGSADDYYSSSSGADILAFSYLMDVVDVPTVRIYAYGLGGCISYIGVDAR